MAKQSKHIQSAYSITVGAYNIKDAVVTISGSARASRFLCAYGLVLRKLNVSVEQRSSTQTVVRNAISECRRNFLELYHSEFHSEVSACSQVLIQFWLEHLKRVKQHVEAGVSCMMVDCATIPITILAVAFRQGPDAHAEETLLRDVVLAIREEPTTGVVHNVATLQPMRRRNIAIFAA
eukprot:Rmarinus@m.12029